MATSKGDMAENLFNAIIQKIDESDNKENYLKYVSQTAETCHALCAAGEEVRALNEIKFMVSNLKKQLDL